MPNHNRDRYDGMTGDELRAELEMRRASVRVLTEEIHLARWEAELNG